MTNTTISIIAMQQASEAKQTSCNAYMASFHPETATVSQMQEYASCVNLIYPQTMTGAEVFIIKALIIAALVGMCFGGWQFWRNTRQYGDALLGGLAGLVFSPAILGIALGVLYSIAWLVGAV